MINYNDGYFNTATLFRIYGSAAYKASVFALISSGIYALAYYHASWADDGGAFGLKQFELLDHPYPVTVIVTAFMAVLSAKVNFCYNRFWEACTALHNMQSKWLDVGSTLAAFHMQSEAYEKSKPPSFGDHPHLHEMGLQGNADIGMVTTEETDKPQSEDSFANDGKRRKSGFSVFGKKGRNARRSNRELELVPINVSASRQEQIPYPDYRIRSRNQSAAEGPVTNETARTAQLSSMSVFEEKRQAAPPSLFMQEAAHLVSLLSAVALSGLRCDSDGAEAVLTEFVPGRHWPNYNSDNDADMRLYGYKRNGFTSTIRYILDVSRTERQREAYNAARPFPVVGGVSDREARLLRKARGPSAKTALAFMWLNEFVIREQLHGSLGSVAPPIVSRLPQYMSDGHLWFNAARKMSYVPFPFPMTQMATLFVWCTTALIPSLMLSKTAVWFGFVLNFLTVLLFAGLNEISKELEFPFRGMPNDLPLNLFQAQFNEALVTMFGGFHPDAWSIEEEMKGSA